MKTYQNVNHYIYIWLMFLENNKANKTSIPPVIRRQRCCKICIDGHPRAATSGRFNDNSLQDWTNINRCRSKPE